MCADVMACIYLQTGVHLISLENRCHESNSVPVNTVGFLCPSKNISSGPEVIKFFSYSAEHEICPADKYQITKHCNFFLAKNS